MVDAAPTFPATLSKFRIWMAKHGLDGVGRSAGKCERILLCLGWAMGHWKIPPNAVHPFRHQIAPGFAQLFECSSFICQFLFPSSTWKHFTQPPIGIHSGIQESALSETSSIWSLISSNSTKTPGGTPLRMGRWAEEENGKNNAAFETPKPPGNWREGRCLGRGAFGHVFVCLNVDTGEQLVVKKIFLHANGRHQRSRVLATLENELNLLGTLRHPNIGQYFGVVASPDCVNIFMELMAGGSLKDQISEYGALGEAMSVHFGEQLLNGLAYLHSKEIVHRDIKPANILRHSRAQVKIGEFGSAKFLQAICSEQGVDIQGTPHYTAPEIIRDNRRFEPRSDVWSVGITMVEMLTTKTPWACIDPAAVHLRIAFDECPPLSQLDGKCSSSLEAAIGLMLKREPEQRPNASELLKMLPFSREEECRN